MSTVNCPCDSSTVGNKTLLQLRTEMMVRLGYATTASNPPPGMADLLDAYLRDAQEQLYLQYKAFRTERFFKWRTSVGGRLYGLTANVDDCPISVVLGDTDAGFYAGTDPISEESAGELGAGGEDINGATLTLFGYFEGTGQYVVAMSGETAPTADVWTTLAFDGDSGPITLTAADATLTAALGAVRLWFFTAANDVSEKAYSLYFDVPNATPAYTLDPQKVTWVGIEDSNGMWQQLHEGIDPRMYTRLGLNTGRPCRYEIRSCIEIFPAPDEVYSLWIKGHFGLAPFEEDDDVVTIDDRAVFLLALGNAQTEKGKPGANNTLKQAGIRIGNLVAGAHHTRRYVPQPHGMPDNLTKPNYTQASED